MKSLLTFLFLSISLLSCSVFNNEQKEEYLLEIMTSRTWVTPGYYDFPDQKRNAYELKFNKDGTYIQSRVFIDENNDELGYTHWMKARFDLKENEMTSSTIKSYEIQPLVSGEFVILPLNELLTAKYQGKDEPGTERINRISLSEANDTLWIKLTGLSAVLCGCGRGIHLAKQ